MIAQVGAPLPIGAKSARLQARVRQLLRRSQTFIDERRPEGRAAPGAAARDAGADPPGRVPGDHVAQGLRAAGVARSSSSQSRRRAGSRPESFGLTPEQLQVVVIAPDGPQRHGRHRHRARGRAAAVGRHREPARRLRRRRGDGGANAAAARRHRRRAHRGAARQQERRCTTTTRTSRRSSTPAARSVCSTTRCSTARTC